MYKVYYYVSTFLITLLDVFYKEKIDEIIYLSHIDMHNKQFRKIKNPMLQVVYWLEWHCNRLSP